MSSVAKIKFPRAKISHAVGTALPKGQSFELRISDSEIGKKKIVRVVTPAWKTLRGWERIGKVLEVVNSALTPQEQKGILRFSVLTPDEYKNLGLGRAMPRKRKALKAKMAVRKAAPRKAEAVLAK